MNTLLKPEKGFWVLLIFVAFFGVIIIVNSIFITTALRTHSGVITDKPYEKGLEFDAMAKAARAQPVMRQTVSYADGVLRWVLADADGVPLQAKVTARLIWPTKDGYDFEVDLMPVGTGIYEAVLELPKSGQWHARLEAKWNAQQYQTRHSFMNKK